MNKKTKISILLPLWQRPDVLSVCLKQLEIFVNSNSKEYDILVFFVYSNNDHFLNEIKTIISEFKTPYKELEHSNMFLGGKMNAGIKFISSFEYDYLMNLGSDDLIHADLLKLYKPYIETKTDIIGIDSCVFFGSSKEILHLKYYNQNRAVGAGRLISKKAIDIILNLGKQVYTHYVQRGLDSDSAIMLERHGIKETVLSTEYPYIVDIKSDTNINSFHDLKANYNFEKISFDALKKAYGTQIIQSIEKGFIKVRTMENKKDFIKCLNVRKNIVQVYNLNSETVSALRTGILVEVKDEPTEPEPQKEIKQSESVKQKVKKNKSK